MSPSNDDRAIKITLEDLEKVPAADPGALVAPAAAGDAKNYGSVADASDEPNVIAPDQRANFFLQGWVYLGLAGLFGSFIAWAIAERGFVDGPGSGRWGNTWLIPMVVILMCVGLGVSESIVERSPRKALVRGGLSLPLGVVLGFLFSFIANIIFGLGVAIVASAGVQTSRNPAFWIARGFGWMVFGVAGGLVYGIIGQSGKKILYGMLGGAIGAGLGGMLFDPIAMLTKGGAASRAVGFALFGLATGIAIGLVESALKDRWLYVTAGPLAGKQFILYKPQTVIGSDQKSDIYLFKDANILPQHAVIEIQGSRVQIRAQGQTYVAGQPTRLQVLQTGTPLQIGRYSFRYQEKQRK